MNSRPTWLLTYNMHSLVLCTGLVPSPYLILRSHSSRKPSLLPQVSIPVSEGPQGSGRVSLPLSSSPC